MKWPHQSINRFVSIYLLSLWWLSVYLCACVWLLSLSMYHIFIYTYCIFCIHLLSEIQLFIPPLDTLPTNPISYKFLLFSAFRPALYAFLLLFSTLGVSRPLIILIWDVSFNRRQFILVGVFLPIAHTKLCYSYSCHICITINCSKSSARSTMVKW